MSVLVGIREVLVRLRDRGPQPTSAIAHEFGLNPLDARILLLDAHLHGLVIRNDWGEWAISQRGREAISTGTDESLDAPRPAPVTRQRSELWRRVPRRTVLVGASAVVCGLGAGVAIGFVNSASGPPQAPANERAEAFVPGHRVARHVRHGSRSTISFVRHFYAQGGIRREFHMRSRPLSRVTAPLVIFEARVGRGTAKATAAQTTVRMALGRKVPGKGSLSCTTTSAAKSAARLTWTRQHSSGSHCSRPAHPPNPSQSG